MTTAHASTSPTSPDQLIIEETIVIYTNPAMPGSRIAHHTLHSAASLDSAASPDNTASETQWRKNGLLHSPDNDTPAVVTARGRQEYYTEGLIHRAHDLPAVEYERSGAYEHYVCGQLHREPDSAGVPQPAVRHADGTLEYWVHDVLHNEHGPAVIHPDGYVEYWKNGIRFTDCGEYNPSNKRRQ